VRILVTGAAGFIGSWALAELERRMYNPVGADKISAPNLIQCDVTNLGSLIQLFERVKPAAVVRLAAISGSTRKNEAEQNMRQPEKNFNTNVIETTNICEATRKTRVRSFSLYGCFRFIWQGHEKTGR